MLGIGMGEMIVIGGIALIVIGPERFPEFAKIVMRTIRDVRGYVDEAKREITKEIAPVKRELDEMSRYDPETYIDRLMADDDEDEPPASDIDDYATYGEEPYEYEIGGKTANTEEKVDLNREDEGLLNYDMGGETEYGYDYDQHITPHPDDYPQPEENEIRTSESEPPADDTHVEAKDDVETGESSTEVSSPSTGEEHGDGDLRKE